MQRHRDAGRGLVVRTALQAREDGLVDRLRVLLAAHQHRAAGAAQRLVGRGGDDVHVPGRGGVRAARDQAGDVGDVRDEDRARLAGDLREGGEVDGPRQGGAPAEDHLGPLGEGQLAHRVVVDEPIRFRIRSGPDAVLHAAEPRARRRDAPAVRQVAAHRQGHAHDRVAGLCEGQVDGQVGRGAGVRLHVGVVHAEQALGPLDRQGLDPVDVLLALVVATAGVALAVLVLQHGAGGFEDGRGHVVLTGDQAQGLRLEDFLRGDVGRQFGVGRGQGGMAARGHGGLLRGRCDRYPARPRRAALYAVERARLPRSWFPVRQSPCVPNTLAAAPPERFLRPGYERR